QGPEEYIEPTDFAVFDEEVIIYDQFRSDMKYYDLEGKLKYQKRTPFLFLNFFMFDSNHYIFQMPGTGNGHLRTIANSYVFESDSSFVLTGMAFSRDDARINDIISNNFYFYNNKAFYNQPYSDTIYSIAPDHKIQIEYIIDFHDKKMPSDMLLKSNEEEFYSLLKTGRYANFTGNYVLTKDYLYFHYSLGGLLHRCFYSKKTKKLITGNGFMNDINFIFPLDIVLTAVDNNVLVGYMQSYYIGENFERNTREEWVKQLGEKYVQIAENIKKEDNPIILFFKFKEF
ncbi:MAG: 6-bladed beta-propeller, partial [Dysgonamonadaceae bacterium]|nr:6-bladed beta-propeller [Dysgonamonadaceae bacterium]